MRVKPVGIVFASNAIEMNRRLNMISVTKAQLMKKVAYLESINDQLITEVSYLDQLMRLIGFNAGLAGVKATAQEILDKGYTDVSDLEVDYPDDDNKEKAWIPNK